MRDGEKVDQACRYPGIEPIKNRSIRVMMAWPIPTNLQVASTHPVLVEYNAPKVAIKLPNNLPTNQIFPEILNNNKHPRSHDVALYFQVTEDFGQVFSCHVLRYITTERVSTRRRWILSFQSGLEGRIGSEVWTDRKAQRLLEMNKVLRKDRSGSVMLLRDLKDLLKDTIRMIPQTRIISHLDDDKDEEEDYDEMILEEDEEQRRKE
ncbi:hypothetical protein BY996DRAFT_6474721 [Phakopsora pachyrhizi]|nr:hypothetical protein BY996DRAFT_6474721 [Phakopsora pachyrhizi]